MLCPIKQLKVECIHAFARRKGIEEKKECPLWNENRGSCALRVVHEDLGAIRNTLAMIEEHMADD